MVSAARSMMMFSAISKSRRVALSPWRRSMASTRATKLSSFSWVAEDVEGDPARIRAAIDEVGDIGQGCFQNPVADLDDLTILLGDGEILAAEECHVCVADEGQDFRNRNAPPYPA